MAYQAAPAICRVATSILLDGYDRTQDVARFFLRHFGHAPTSAAGRPGSHRAGRQRVRTIYLIK